MSNFNIQKKSEFSIEKLGEFKEKLKSSQELQNRNNLCIYVTGSYGRYEAAEQSDLDLFFLYENDKNDFSRIDKTLIDAHIIQCAREMKLPEFSGDGKYLEMHNINDLYNEMGSVKDDYYNYFSARMLLLLESRPIYNESLYEKILHETVKRYYKDFHRHEKNFQPVFLVNDIIRFWRTMCLNYEHNRHRKLNGKHTSEELEVKKCESHIKNLKLKFSRKLTCYSFLLHVLWGDVVKQDNVIDLIKLTPLERLKKLEEFSGASEKVNEMISLYFWFLNTTQVEKNDIIQWIGNKKNRDDAFDKSRQFAKLVFDLMQEAPNSSNKLMYFLV